MLGQVQHTALDVVVEVGEVHPKLFGGVWHQLHDALRLFGRHGQLIESALLLGNRQRKGWIYFVGFGGINDDLGNPFFLLVKPAEIECAFCGCNLRILCPDVFDFLLGNQQLQHFLARCNLFFNTIPVQKLIALG